MDPGIVGPVRAVQRLQTEAGNYIGRQSQVYCPAHQQRAHGHHLGRAVQQGQSFLGGQFKRPQPSLFQGFCTQRIMFVEFNNSSPVKIGCIQTCEGYFFHDLFDIRGHFNIQFPGNPLRDPALDSKNIGPVSRILILPLHPVGPGMHQIDIDVHPVPLFLQTAIQYIFHIKFPGDLF